MTLGKPSDIRLAPINMPIIGLGTYCVKGEDIYGILKAGFENGITHVDCAAIYANERDVGVALRRLFDEGVVKREDIFVTSKLWNTCHDRVEEAIQRTLKDLQLDYVDLYLIHWPVPWQFQGYPVELHNEPIPAKLSIESTWRQMEAVQRKGLTKHIGVSNWTIAMLRDLVNLAEIPPAVNQIELHPYNSRYEHVKEAQALGVNIVGWSPIGQGRTGVLTDPVILRLAEKHNCTAAQVIFGWFAAKGVAAIPRTSNPGRIPENSRYAILSEEDTKQVDALNKNELIVDVAEIFKVSLFSTKSVL